MKAVIFIAIASLSISAFAKVIEKNTPDYANMKTWQVGDVVDGKGKVIKKEIVGEIVKVDLEDDGMKIHIESDYK